MAQELSIENLTIPQKIIEAIKSAGEAIISIKVSDLPAIWQSIKEGVVNLGKQLLLDIKDFFFKDVPGLIIDVGAILVHLAKNEIDKVGQRARSALNRLTKVLEVLSFIPLFAVFCSIFLMCIYLCQQEWLLAVCAVIGLLAFLKPLIKMVKGIKFGKITDLINSLKRNFPSANKKNIKEMAKSAKSTKSTSTPSNIKTIPQNSQTARQSMNTTAQPTTTNAKTNSSHTGNTASSNNTHMSNKKSLDYVATSDKYNNVVGSENNATYSLKDGNVINQKLKNQDVKQKEQLYEFNLNGENSIGGNPFQSNDNIITGIGTQSDTIGSTTSRITIGGKLDIDDVYHYTRAMNYADDAPYDALLANQLSTKNKFGL